jgi:hypothetical protein
MGSTGPRTALGSMIAPATGSIASMGSMGTTTTMGSTTTTFTWQHRLDGFDAGEVGTEFDDRAGRLGASPR